MSSIFSRLSMPKTAVRIELFDDVVESLHLFDPLTGQVLVQGVTLHIFPQPLRDPACNHPARH